jgi:protein TonB
MILRGASNGEILAFVPPEARRRRQAGRSAVSCLIRPDTRLEACRVVNEQPGDFGFGDAAVRIAETHFRFRPPTTASGQAVEGFRVTVTVNFGRQGR